MLDDLLENPPDETPGWHASELETSQMLAYEGGRLVHMDRAVNTRAGKPAWLPDSLCEEGRRARRGVPRLPVFLVPDGP